MRHSRITALAATAAMAVIVPLGVAAANAGTAHASGTLIQTVSKSEHIVSAKCYTYVQLTTTYYHWSSKTGWTPYPAPKITRTTGETCHA